MENNRQRSQVISLSEGSYYLLYMVGTNIVESEMEMGEDLEAAAKEFREQGIDISEELLEEARLLRDEGDGDKTLRHAIEDDGEEL